MAPQDDSLRAQVEEMRVLREALPSMSSGGDSAGAAAPAEAESYDDEDEAAEPPAATVRRAHDRAMSVIQSN